MYFKPKNGFTDNIFYFVGFTEKYSYDLLLPNNVSPHIKYEIYNCFIWLWSFKISGMFSNVLNTYLYHRKLFVLGYESK